MYGNFIKNISRSTDSYGFVDENEIRIATWITLVLGLTTFFLVLLKAEYTIAFYIIIPIWLDFILKVFISPRWSIFWSFVRLFLDTKNAVWVGAVQKRFAWGIGLFISTFVLYCLVLLSGEFFNVSSPEVSRILEITQMNIASWALIVAPITPPVILCVLCLIFMWSESVVGYCIGCSIYKQLTKRGWMKEYENQNCVNWVCTVK